MTPEAGHEQRRQEDPGQSQRRPDLPSRRSRAVEAAGRGSLLEQISAHIERHLGPIEMVFHEIVSDTVHIDVHWVKPTRDFPFARLVTSGMSDLPMSVPEDSGAPAHLELMITLPGQWRFDEDALDDERWYWPVGLLKALARFPTSTTLGSVGATPSPMAILPNRMPTTSVSPERCCWNPSARRRRSGNCRSTKTNGSASSPWSRCSPRR